MQVTIWLKNELKPTDVFVLENAGNGCQPSACLSAAVTKLDFMAEPDTSYFIVVDGKRRSLLDEVDVICATSGGAFPAAYFALHREEFFKSFEKRFLKRNVQSELYGELIEPDESGPFLAQAFKVVVDKHVGKIVYMRCARGKISAESIPVLRAGQRCSGTAPARVRQRCRGHNST